MKRIKKVLVVGAGGIGSWLAGQLYHLTKHSQINNLEITFADNDTVDTKNLGYQLFEPTDLTDNKAIVLSLRYQFTAISKRIESEKQLEGYDCIICAVDNSKFRRILFNYAETHPDVYWIDLRSEGQAAAMFTKHTSNTLAKMLKTIPGEENDGMDGSCQLEFELNNGIIQLGNRIIATIGAQLLLNWYRGETNPPKLTFRI